MNVITKEKELGYHRGETITSINLIEYYHKTKNLIGQLDAQIEDLRGRTGSNKGNFRNPREEMTHLHDVKTLAIVSRQRERLATKLEELHRRIQASIETAK